MLTCRFMPVIHPPDRTCTLGCRPPLPSCVIRTWMQERPSASISCCRSAKEKPPSRPRTADFRAEVGGLDVGHIIRVETEYGDVRFCSSRGLKAGSGSARLCQTSELENAQHA